MSWRVTIYFDDGSETIDDSVYDSKESAQNGFELWAEDWEAGKDTLMMAGEDYVDKEIDGYDIWEE